MRMIIQIIRFRFTFTFRKERNERKKDNSYEFYSALWQPFYYNLATLFITITTITTITITMKKLLLDQWQGLYHTLVQCTCS